MVFTDDEQLTSTSDVSPPDLAPCLVTQPEVEQSKGAPSKVPELVFSADADSEIHPISLNNIANSEAPVPELTPGVAVEHLSDQNNNSTEEVSSPALVSHVDEKQKENVKKDKDDFNLNDLDESASSVVPINKLLPCNENEPQKSLANPNVVAFSELPPLPTEWERVLLLEDGPENYPNYRCMFADSEASTAEPCVESETETFRKWYLSAAPALLQCYCDPLIQAGFESVDFFADITASDLDEVPGMKAGHRKALLKLAGTLKSTDEKVKSGEKNKAAVKQSDDSEERLRYAPGIHVVPHKVLVMDKAKAMKENPHLKPEDFVALKGEGAVRLDDTNLISILVVGASGSGKTTMINSMSNYLFGVRFEDEFRLKLILEPATEERKTQAASQTNQVFGYLLDSPPAMKGKSLLIIDTPGFGDSRGVASDEAHVDEIQKFFENVIDFLNGVCFVCKAPDSRVTATQRWIFDKILGLFGKDIESIINLAFTFADAHAPPALAAIEAVGIKYNKMFKLNNSAFFAPFGKDILESDPTAPIYWKLGVTAFEHFVNGISSTAPKSLVTTRTVLRHREQVRCSIETLRLLIDDGINKLCSLERTCQLMVTCRSLLDQNKNFSYVETGYRREKKDKPRGTYNTVCDTCQWTCHHSCTIENNSDKARCVAMAPTGYCKQCPKKCHWGGHSNLSYYWDLVSFEVKKTNAELEARYVTASSDKSKYEQIISGLKEEFDAVQVDVFNLVRLVKDAVNELNRLALRPGCYHTDEYFDVMIEQETKEKHANWRKRVEQLKVIKDRSKYTSEVASNDKYDPFEEYRRRVEDQAKQGSVGVVWIQAESHDSCGKTTRYIKQFRQAVSSVSSAVSSAVHFS